ncbi:MAG: apolipoprotein N-acyltransferase [Bacteroidales bacterium]|nr:apolipoprotein N-acyltransferase [Bacteroidales bacterium]
MKRKYFIGLSLLSAFLLSLAWPANGFVPLLFIAWVPLLMVEDKFSSNAGKAAQKGLFAYAYLTFVVWNALTTWWIWNSTGFGAIMAIGLNSLFMTTVFWLFHYTKRKLFQNGKGHFILIIYWMTWEWFHLDWDLSWPWLNLGNAFASQHTWIQWYEYTGTAGGTLWVLIVNILVFKILKLILEKKTSQITFKLQVASLSIILLAPILISKMIYRNYQETGEKVEVVVVQPNFDPYTEQYEVPPEQVIERNLNLASAEISHETKFVVSPESAIQEEIWMELTDSSTGLQIVKSFAEAHPQLAVVIGASTFSHVPANHEDDPAARKFRRGDGYYFAHNTAFFVDSAGNFPFYYKSKLTPGVEMMPSWRLLRPLKNFAIDLGGTVGTLKTSDTRTVFTHRDGKSKVGTIICYESIYGEFVAKFVLNGANLLFIITNDGWWGNTPGHRQHLSFARLRAIETRRSIARSANTGISGFFDQRGDLFQATAYAQQAVIKQNLTLNDNITFYVKTGDYLSRIAALISGLFALMTFVRMAIKPDFRKKSKG